jgi:hypothetical protein
MERFWSLAVATGGKRWQIGRLRKRPKLAKTVANRCDQWSSTALTVANPSAQPPMLPDRLAGDTNPSNLRDLIWVRAAVGSLTGWPAAAVM